MILTLPVELGGGGTIRASSSGPGEAGQRLAHLICYIAMCDLAPHRSATESNVFLWPPIRDL